MGYFPKPSGPRAAWRDLRTFLATRQRHQLLFAALSIAIPVLLIAGFVHDSNIAPPPPTMTFIPSWPATRSDAEIEAQQKIDQVAKDKALAERRAAYRRLAKSFGVE